MTAEAIRYLIIISSTAAVIIIAAVIYIITKARYKKEFLEKKQELQKFQLKEIQQYENEISSLLDEINSKKRNSEFLQELVSDCEKYVGLHYSGNSMVDALLAYKQKLCEDSEVALEISAGTLKGTALTDEEYIGIFGNLLDNAIEASMKLPENQRLIRVYMDMKNTQLYISFTNFTAGGKMQKEGKLFRSTKGDGHGFGLVRIDAIIEQHDGYISRNSEDGAFTTEILLPQV